MNNIISNEGAYFFTYAVLTDAFDKKNRSEAGVLNLILELFSNFEKCIFLHSLVTYNDKYS